MKPSGPLGSIVLAAFVSHPLGATAGDEIPPRARCLIEAYPDWICGATAESVRLCDGTILPWDDGRAAKTHEEALESPDLEDQMAQAYPAGPSAGPPAEGFEPGRVRYAPLFRAMYGSTPSEVARRLVSVRWLPGISGRRLRVTATNGVAERLDRISSEILLLPRPLARAVAASGGGFAWRPIAGTVRVSPHAFGIAVDVGVDRADYWRWSRSLGRGVPRYRNRIPLEVVEIFERHGFIWGGKWWRFDTMHFEYRPEFFVAACRAP